MGTRGALATGGCAALAVVIGTGGHRGAAATFEAVEITVAVVIVLAVAGLLAALIIRARGDRRIYRQEPPGGPLRVRAVVVDRTSPQPSRAARGAQGLGGGRGVPSGRPMPRVLARWSNLSR
jgi:hypothetical protein